jgi:rSAM/selenodomain-associated transferase 1
MRMGTLIIFARYPCPGQVKTRLAADVGATAAATLYEAFLLDALEHTDDVSERRVIAFAPATVESRLYFETVRLKGDILWSQPPGDLGERLRAAFEFGIELGGPAVVIGSDCPTLPPETIREAFARLETNDAVIVPAADGGYGLIGLSSAKSRVFDDIPWSTPEVYAATVERFRACQLTYRALPECRDIDGVEDLRWLAGAFSGREREAGDHVPRRTLAAIRSLRIR